jgi:signal peptidase I
LVAAPTILVSVFARFEVAEMSMAPALLPGDWLVAARLAIRSGDVVVFEHPGRPGFHLCKRVGHTDGKTMFVLSDSNHPTAVDSRRFGPVPTAKAYLVHRLVNNRGVAISQTEP